MGFKIIELPKNIRIGRNSETGRFLSKIDNFVYNVLTDVQSFDEKFASYYSLQEIDFDFVLNEEKIYRDLKFAWENQVYNFLSDIILEELDCCKYVTLATKENRENIGITLLFEKGRLSVFLFNDSAFQDFVYILHYKKIDWIKNSKFIKEDGTVIIDIEKLEKTIEFEDRVGFQIYDYDFFQFCKENGLVYLIKQDLDFNHSLIGVEVLENLNEKEQLNSYEYENQIQKISLILTKDNQEIVSIRAEAVIVSEK